MMNVIYHQMEAATITLKGLNELLSPTDPMLAAGRIQHWINQGLFKTTDVDLSGIIEPDLGQVRVGRGRARTYPATIVPPSVLFMALADMQIPIAGMAMIMTGVRMDLLKARRSRKADLWKQALNGRGDHDVFLVARYVPFGEGVGNTPSHFPQMSAEVTLTTKIAKVAATLERAIVINLTNLFARVRSFNP